MGFNSAGKKIQKPQLVARDEGVRERIRLSVGWMDALLLEQIADDGEN